MAKKQVRPPFGLLIASALLVAFGLIYKQFILITIPVAKQIDNIIFTAVTFICIFVAILLVYIFLINLISQILNNRIPEKIYKPINLAFTLGIILSILMMLQPFTIVLYRISFPILLVSLLSFILWSHISPYKMPDEEIAA